MSTTEILAVIGGITLILTNAAKIPAALAEFLRACILVANAARDLRAALTQHAPRDGPEQSGTSGRGTRPGHDPAAHNPGNGIPMDDVAAQGSATANEK